jgi:YggT family protein
MALGLAQLIELIFRVFNLIILARIFLSWVQLDPSNPIVQFIHRATEPFLAPIRSRLPRTWMFDFSPLVLLVISFILETVLIQLLSSF